MKIYNVRIDKFIEICRCEDRYRFNLKENSSKNIECIKYGDDYYDIKTGLPYKYIHDEKGYIKDPEEIEENILYAFEAKEKNIEEPTLGNIIAKVRAKRLLSKLENNK